MAGSDAAVRKIFPAHRLARDRRFFTVHMAALVADRRSAHRGRRTPGARGGPAGRLSPSDTEAPDAVRQLVHGVLVGEIQALEGAGRTCWDFPVADAGPSGSERSDAIPFELKLDMARQCWDEARHCEISCRVAEWTGTAIGEFSESLFLYQTACNRDPVLRLTGVNRGLEGLAIDVFNSLREFGRVTSDPLVDFVEDWMLADEVTHVKMGSDWLRRLTEDDPDRRQRALEFQRVVDKLFSLDGFRGEEPDSTVRLARRYRELAGFEPSEIDDLAEASRTARREAEEARASSGEGRIRRGTRARR
jgi:uncharacterized ferritin-like protein (DUF455 family)